jgi:excisionase family DNA binding protein
MFVQAASPPVGFGPIKIEGVLGTQIADKLRDLSAKNAFDTYLIGLTPTTTPAELEQAIHLQFAEDVLHHDWFSPSPDLLTFIQIAGHDALQELLTQARPAVPAGAVDVETIAKLLDVSVATVRRAVKAGEIPYFRMGKVLRFMPADVLASLERNR